MARSNAVVGAARRHRRGARASRWRAVSALLLGILAVGFAAPSALAATTEAAEGGDVRAAAAEDAPSRAEIRQRERAEERASERLRGRVENQYHDAQDARVEARQAERREARVRDARRKVEETQAAARSARDLAQAAQAEVDAMVEEVARAAFAPVTDADDDSSDEKAPETAAKEEDAEAAADPDPPADANDADEAAVETPPEDDPEEENLPADAAATAEEEAASSSAEEEAASSSDEASSSSSSSSLSSLQMQLEEATEAAASARLEVLDAEEKMRAFERRRAAETADARAEGRASASAALESMRASLDEATERASRFRAEAKDADERARRAVAAMQSAQTRATIMERVGAENELWLEARKRAMGSEGISRASAGVGLPRLNSANAADDSVSVSGQKTATPAKPHPQFPPPAFREVWFSASVPAFGGASHAAIRASVLPALRSAIGAAELPRAFPGFREEAVSLVRANFVVIGGVAIPGEAAADGRRVDELCDAVAMDVGAKTRCYRNGTDARTNGLDLVFALTDERDPEEYARALAKLEMSRVSSDAGFAALAATTGGFDDASAPTLTFVRHHARAMFAVRVEAFAAEGVKRALEAPEAKAALERATGGKASLEGVEVRRARPPEYDPEGYDVSDYDESENEAESDDEAESDAAAGSFSDASSRAAALAAPRRRRDVWVTVQVPSNSGGDRKDFRESLVPVVASLASAGGTTGVTEGDLALVESHFILIGGIIVPGARGVTDIGSVVSVDTVCKGLAADVGVDEARIRCYENGTAIPEPPAPEDEYYENPYGEEYVAPPEQPVELSYEDKLAMEEYTDDDGVYVGHQLITPEERRAQEEAARRREEEESAREHPDSAFRFHPVEDSEAYSDDLERGALESIDAPQIPDAEEISTADMAYEDALTNPLGDAEEEANSSKRRARLGLGWGRALLEDPAAREDPEWDPNAVREGDYTFTDHSLPDVSDAAGVEGQVIVFAITGLHDQSDFTEVVAKVDLSQVSGAAEFHTVEALTGGKTPVLQFARHHARLTFAIRVRDEANEDAVMAALRDPEAQKKLTEAMHGRSLIRDVKLKLPPPAELDPRTHRHVSADATENKTYEGLWTDEPEVDEDAATARVGMTASERAPESRGAAVWTPDRDVWATLQVPTALGSPGRARDDVFATAALMARVPPEDVALVESRLVLVGGMLVAKREAAEAVDARDACDALAADLRIDDARLGCFSNGTKPLPSSSAALGGVGEEIVFAVTGVEDPRRFRAVVARVAELERRGVRASDAVARLGAGGEEDEDARPATTMLFHRHDAHLTFAFAASDAARARAIVEAVRSPEARETLRAATGAEPGTCRARDVAVQPPPFDRAEAEGTTRMNSEKKNSRESSEDVAPLGVVQNVWFTVDAPVGDALPGEEMEARTLAGVRELVREAATGTLGSSTRRSGDVRENPDLAEISLARAAFVVTGEVAIPGVVAPEALDADRLCAALALDLGAETEKTHCYFDESAAKAAKAANDAPLLEEIAAELGEASEDALPADLRRGRRAARRVARRTARRDDPAASLARLGSLDVGSSRAGESDAEEVRVVFAVVDVPDREEALRLLKRARGDEPESEPESDVFSTARAMAGGGFALRALSASAEVTMTFAAATRDARDATRVRDALAAPSANAALSGEAGGKVDVHDVWIDQSPPGVVRAAAKAKALPALGSAPKRSSKRSKKRRREETRRDSDSGSGSDSAERRAGSRDDDASAAPSYEMWATAQVPVMVGGDPHALAARLAPKLTYALAGTLPDVERSIRYAGASYVVVGAVTIPGRRVVPGGHRGLSVEQACAAVAVDIGARAEDVTCRLNGTAAIERATREADEGTSEGTPEGTAKRREGTAASTTRRGRRAGPPASESEPESDSVSEKKKRGSKKKDGLGFAKKAPRGQSLVFTVEGVRTLSAARRLVAAASSGPGAFATTSAVAGGAAAAGAAASARHDAMLTFAVTAPDEQTRARAAARLRARDLDPDLSALVGGRAVLRVLDAVPETAVVEALERKKPEALTSTLGEGAEGAEESSDATSDSGETSSSAPAASSSSSSDEDPDASDASVFMRDVPGEKGKQGALGGASTAALAAERAAKLADAKLALRQATSRTAKAQLDAFRSGLRIRPKGSEGFRRAALGAAAAERGVEARREGFGAGAATAIGAAIGIGAAATAFAAARKRRVDADAAERLPLIATR